MSSQSLYHIFQGYMESVLNRITIVEYIVSIQKLKKEKTWLINCEFPSPSYLRDSVELVFEIGSLQRELIGKLVGRYVSCFYKSRILQSWQDPCSLYRHLSGPFVRTGTQQFYNHNLYLHFLYFYHFIYHIIYHHWRFLFSFRTPLLFFTIPYHPLTNVISYTPTLPEKLFLLTYLWISPHPHSTCL